mgnify:FL=1
MALLYYLDEIAGIPIVRVVVNGAVSFYEWVKVQIKIWSDDQVPKAYRLCAEMLPGTSWNNVSPTELDLLLRLEKLSPKTVGAKEAIIARPHGIRRRIRWLFTCPVPRKVSTLRIFGDKNEAMSWLLNDRFVDAARQYGPFSYSGYNSINNLSAHSS